MLVDTSDLEVTLGDRLAVALERDLPSALREAGFEVVRGGAAVTFEVRLAMSDVDLREYAISVDALADGGREVLVDARRCLACSEQQVVARVIELVAGIASWEPEPEPPTPCMEEAPRSAATPTPRRTLGVGRLGFAGGVSFSAGLATVGGGVLMMTMPDLDWDVDPRTVGMGIVVAGTGAAAVGLTIFVVDAVLLEGRRRKVSLSVLPSLSPMNGGVLVVGRF
ncbi:hypothetical protein DB30_01503 [Enhygromyxa salina]|uniref:Uncharacterized protein n=1 Tax=Enhygromyxa salina TaxID=215803 RepID=A0A0C1ZMW9_9BACT|nr:hypothetical protein DB30_01503 [Enhygromyxa salina]